MADAREDDNDAIRLLAFLDKRVWDYVEAFDGWDYGDTGCNCCQCEPQPEDFGLGSEFRMWDGQPNYQLERKV